MAGLISFRLFGFAFILMGFEFVGIAAEAQGAEGTPQMDRKE